MGMLMTAIPVTASPLKGVVYAANGTPAAGARVWAGPFDLSPWRMIQDETDDQGCFELSLAPGEWTVRARFGPQGGEAVDAYGMVKIQEGHDPSPVEIRLTERCTLEGRLIDAENGKPIPAGRIWLDTGELVTADAEGRYETGGLREGDHHLFLLCPGYARARVLFDTSLRPKAELDVRLRRAGRIVGQVLDLDGNPIPSAKVGYPTSGNTISLSALYERCDAQGRFEWDGATYGSPVRLQAEAAGYESVLRAGIVVTPESSPVSMIFRLARKNLDHPEPAGKAGAQSSQTGSSSAPVDEPRRAVRGIVYGADDKPLGSAQVRWGATEYEGTKRQARTDSQGRFMLERVPDRKGYITVLAPPHAPSFEQVPGGGDCQIEVRLEEGATVTGKVEDAAHRPLGGVTVIPVLRSPDPSLCNPLWLSEIQAKTDAQGRFRVVGLPQAGALFDFLGAGLSELREQDVEDGSTITMQAGGAIRGKVVDAAGKPVRDFRILLNIPREHARGESVGGYFAGYCGPGVSFTSPDGTFVVSDLKAGTLLRVSAVAEGYGQAEQDRVEAAPITGLPLADELTLELGEPHRLRVVVATDELHVPVDAACLTLIEASRGEARSFRWGADEVSWNNRVGARTKPTGVAAFAAPFGEGTLIVRADGYGRQRQHWATEDELTFELEPQAIVTGRATDPDGRPLAECTVRLNCSTGDSFWFEVAPQDEGRYRFDELPAGDYTLTIERDRQQLYKDAFTLEAGQTHEVVPADSATETRETAASAPG